MTARLVQLNLAAGVYDIQIGRFGCPGMPSDCSMNPYADQYRASAALWTYSVGLRLEAGDVTRIRVRVTLAGDEAPRCAAD